MGCHFVNGSFVYFLMDGNIVPTPHQDSFYRPLTPEQSAAAYRNEYDFDSPEAIDFDVLVERLKDIKEGYVSPDPLH